MLFLLKNIFRSVIAGGASTPAHLLARERRRIFCVWTGTNAMSENRRRALQSVLDHSGCPVMLITPDNLSEIVVPGSAFHAAYEYLSATHKSDYLRCYLMHHYGGGYTDIKFNYANWNLYFEMLDKSRDKLAIGYREVGENGVAVLPGELGQKLRQNWFLLMGNCAYIFKPQSPFTREWYDTLHRRLDTYLPELERNPARFPQDVPGAVYEGKPGNYPVPWTAILGDIFHPVCLKYADKLLLDLPPPSFAPYR